MAFKDLTDYYVKVRDAYFDTLAMCQEFDKEHREGLLEDKDFKKFTKNVKVLRERYETVADFFLLWSKPSVEETNECNSWTNSKDNKNKTEYNYISKRFPDKELKADGQIVDDIKKYIEKLKG